MKLKEVRNILKKLGKHPYAICVWRIPKEKPRISKEEARKIIEELQKIKKIN